MAELKPCPFCGGEATLVTTHNDNLTWVRYFVSCRRCLVETHRHEKHKTAELVWNRRAKEDV